jgi:vancomycin resistance protein YoaR
VVAGSVSAALVLLTAVAALAVSDRVPRGTRLAGVDIGGLTGAQAERMVAGRLASAAAAPLPVTVGSAAATVDPREAGLVFDPAAEIDRVVGFSMDPRRLWQHVAGPVRTSDPRIDVAALTAALDVLASATDVPAENAALVVQGDRGVAKPASTGVALDVAGAARVLGQGWLGADGPIALPVRTTEPTVGDEAARAALARLLAPALDGPLTVEVGARSVEVSPKQFGPTLSVVPDPAGQLQLAVDGARLREILLGVDGRLETRPRDARIELKAGAPVVVPGAAGETIDGAALAAAAREALTGPTRKAVVKPTEREPDLTTEKAKDLGVTERVSTFSTNLTSNAARTENLTIAARTVNGTLVLPGGTFSLNETLGQRTAAKGYNQAPAINAGRLVRDYGGGVSQMATTIFNNVFFAGLQDVYHKPHSFYISRYPEGREATVDWPTVDLKWKNDSPYAVLIQANVSGGKVNVSFWSTKVWDVTSEKGPRTNYRQPKTIYDPSPQCVTQVASPGFDVVVRRLFHRNGKLVRTESFRTTYIAEDKVVCGPKPSASPSPPASG